MDEKLLEKIAELSNSREVMEAVAAYVWVKTINEAAGMVAGVLLLCVFAGFCWYVLRQVEKESKRHASRQNRSD